jgi:transposase InsO family protein
MREHREFSVVAMCRVLGVSKSGYYAARERPPSKRQQHNDELMVKIRASHEASDRNYGSPRVHKDLTEAGEKVSRKTVAKLMKADELTPPRPKPFKPMTTDSNHTHPIAPNLLNRQFEQPAPDCAWVSDITYVRTAEGWLYVAAVMDLCTRRVIGYAMADHLRASLAIDAMDMALRNRRGRIAPGLIHHSDRGVQYACASYRALLEAHGVTPSMSRTGNCYDNAAMESLFATLKRECTNRYDFPTRDAAAARIVQYLETFYNRTRRHSALGYLSPAEFERNLAA